MVAKQQQETQKIKKKTEENNAIADVNRTKAVLEVELTKQILQKEAEKDISLIQNEIFKIAEENKANVRSSKSIFSQSSHRKSPKSPSWQIFF